MKLKSNKANWATVLCAAAVFSLISLRDAQAQPRPGPLPVILPPQPINGTTDQPILVRPIQPPPPIITNGASSDELKGDFSGRLIID
jgi:hypothetical protein